MIIKKKKNNQQRDNISLQQWQWQQGGMPGCCFYAGADSSPQTGFDFFIVKEDRAAFPINFTGLGTEPLSGLQLETPHQACGNPGLG